MSTVRAGLFSAIEAERSGARLLAYVTSDRQPPFAARMAGDIIRPVYDHLSRIGRVERIDLFIFSLGGDTIVPWRLVNLIREYCDTFSVLVPYKAHSAATLVALGADEIVMGPMGELSPIDPSIGTPFNPPHTDNPSRPKLEISVEDVNGFINLARDRIGITEQEHLIRVFEGLGHHLHPMALGAVYRSQAMIRLVAAKLLAFHLKAEDAHRIAKVVDNLAEKLYYHNYLISRREAAELGLRIINPSPTLEKALWDLYLAYEAEMELGKGFDPLALLGEKGDSEITASLAVIESRGLRSVISKHLRITRLPQPTPTGQAALQIQEQILDWETRSESQKDT